VLGAPSSAQAKDLEAAISAAIDGFGLKLGGEVQWHVNPVKFRPSPTHSSAVVFFGAPGAELADAAELFRRGISILPIASKPDNVKAEIPANLSAINCLIYADGGAHRVASALLECVGLLPKQRRVFISYRRPESRDAALQLFSQLSEHHFEVFLDTHGISPAEHFQDMLWHKLCDSDVLVMLDTATYFKSKWTDAEFGSALAKGIGILQLVWPGVTPSPRTGTTTRLQLAPRDITRKKLFSADALLRIRAALEVVRTKSHAVRSVNMVSKIREAVQKIGGKIDGVGASRAVHVQIPGGANILIVPALGVPTSTTLHDASIGMEHGTVAVVYDHVGLRRRWIDHLDWLGERITDVRWMKESNVALDLAQWNTP
jgi:hypothetical protein